MFDCLYPPNSVHEPVVDRQNADICFFLS